jgi:hypothetical protein
MENIQPHKWLIALGIMLVAAGIVWWLLENKLSTLGKLPGDIRIQKPRFSFYFPLTSMLLISAIINLIIWLIRKLF